jgi:hypothetical protein
MKMPAIDRSWRVLVAIALAFLIAPAIPALTLPYFTPLFSEPGSPRYAVGGIFFFYVASLQFGTLLGLPSFLILRKWNLVRWWSAVLCGAIIGGGIAAALAGVGFPAKFLASWAGAGAVAAFVFWFVLSAGGVFDETPVNRQGSHAA